LRRTVAFFLQVDIELCFSALGRASDSCRLHLGMRQRCSPRWSSKDNEDISRYYRFKL